MLQPNFLPHLSLQPNISGESVDPPCPILPHHIFSPSFICHTR